MAVYASKVTGPTSEVSMNVASLSKSFTDAMISISDGDSVSTVGTKLKEDVKDNAGEIVLAACAMANAANNYDPSGGD